MSQTTKETDCLLRDSIRKDMRKSIDHMLGQRWGRVLRSYWTWWRDRALERDGTAAVSVAAKAYQTMQLHVRELAQTVSQQEMACDRAERIYLAKVNEYCQCQRLLERARPCGDRTVIRAEMYRAQRLEGILPQLKDNVERGDRCLQIARQTLQQEKDQLETYRYQLHELYSRARANQTLTTLVQVTSQQGETARDRFDRAKAAIEDRQHYARALYDLSHAAEPHSASPEPSLTQSPKRQASISLDSTAQLRPRPVRPRRRPQP